VKEKSISIPIGREKFRTKTDVCEKCGHYALTPTLRQKMEAWGRSLRKNVIEPQPLFTETTHALLEETASKFGIKKVPLIKAMISFYLNRIVGRNDFEPLKQSVEKQEGYSLMMNGKKVKVSVPIHFLTFKKLDLFSNAWKTTHAKAIEDAVLFCSTVLTYPDTSRLKEIAKRFEEFVEDYALAA
jgi:hypothetical protein